MYICYKNFIHFIIYMAPEHNLFVLLFSMLAINSFNSAKEKKKYQRAITEDQKSQNRESMKIVHCISIISIASQPAI